MFTTRSDIQKPKVLPQVINGKIRISDDCVIEKGLVKVIRIMTDIETESGRERYIEANLTSYIPDGNLQLQGCVSQFCLVNEEPDQLLSNIFQIRVKN